MSQDSVWEVQAAVFSRLAAASSLTAVLADGADSVFDHVPQGSAFPYIVLGEISAQSFETQGGGGYDITLAVHSYSKGLGMKEVRGIMAAVFAQLHEASFAVTGQTLVQCRLASAETRLEADGLTRHGLQHFRIITEPA